jgi:hypothetical protein
VAPKPDRELAEARACIDRGDERRALKRLDRSRRGYLKQHDADGLEHLLLLADVLEAADERTRIGRDNLVYAIKQNLRFESRRRGQPDPYPDLQGPAEHTRIAFTRPVKVAIGIATLLGALALLGVIVASFAFSSSGTEVTVRLVNDTPERVSFTGCGDPGCNADSTWTHAELDPGRFTERQVPADDVIELFQVNRSGSRDWCLPLRVHDAYVRHGSDPTVVLVARLSRATPCPGTTVLPATGPESGL